MFDLYQYFNMDMYISHTKSIGEIIAENITEKIPNI